MHRRGLRKVDYGDRRIKDLDKYLSLFANADPQQHKAIGEASTHYLFQYKETIENIKKLYDNHRQIMKEIYQFLEIREDYLPENISTRYNRSGSPRFKLVDRIFGRKSTVLPRIASVPGTDEEAADEEAVAASACHPVNVRLT